MDISRLRKRDSPLTQVRKVARQATRQDSGGGTSPRVGVTTTFTSGGDAPGIGDGESTGVQVTVYVYATANTKTRASLKPEGALGAVDDPDNNQILLRHSPLSDPLNFL